MSSLKWLLELSKRRVLAGRCDRSQCKLNFHKPQSADSHAKIKMMTNNHYQCANSEIFWEVLSNANFLLSIFVLASTFGQMKHFCTMWPFLDNLNNFWTNWLLLEKLNNVTVSTNSPLLDKITTFSQVHNFWLILTTFKQFNNLIKVDFRSYF